MPDSGYAVEKFYTDSRDNKGHKADFRVAIPTGVASQLGEMIASKRVPEYRTMGDIFRDSVIHRLTWLKDEFHIEELDRPITMWTIACETQMMMDEDEAAEQACRNIEDLVRRARTDEAMDAAQVMVSKAVDIAKEPYKSRLMALRLNISR